MLREQTILCIYILQMMVIFVNFVTLSLPLVLAQQWMDINLSSERRALLLLDQMTLDEKVFLLEVKLDNIEYIVIMKQSDFHTARNIRKWICWLRSCDPKVRHPSFKDK